MITSLDWPTEKSFPRFLATINEALTSKLAQRFLLNALNKYRVEKATLDNQAIAAVRDTFGKLNVHFLDISKTFVGERPVYNVVSWFPILGLYLGFSVMTTLEVVDFFFDFIEYINLKGKNIRLHKNLVDLKKALRKLARESEKFDFDQKN